MHPTRCPVASFSILHVLVLQVMDGFCQLLQCARLDGVFPFLKLTLPTQSRLGIKTHATVASLVKGTISITSKPMAGTEITLRVPVAVNRESQAISGAA